MKKKVKFLYIDKHTLTRNFFESCLKSSRYDINKSIELVTLVDFSTFIHNLRDFTPDLVFFDVDTFLSEANTEDFKKALEKDPYKYVVCGKIEDVEQAKLDWVWVLKKPYFPHDLGLQMRTFLPNTGKENEVH